MRNAVTVLFIILAFFLFGHFSPVNAEDRSIHVTSPNGGETFKEGDTVNITWDSSSNIDKVAIGYSSGPGSLDWIAFTAPNTHSYTWTVDVGNTTNTQFLIDITGYETGQGSVNDKSDNYFTVIQKEEYPPTPTYAAPTSVPRVTQTWIAPTSTISHNTTTTAPPTQFIQQNNFLTIYNITLWTVFYFDGSQTTNLKDLKDPKHVEDFTLDTKSGYEFVFLDTLDLTNKQTLNALDSIENYWVIDEAYIWFKAEWWEKYDITTPIEVKLKDDNFTTFPPKVSNDLSSTDSSVTKQKISQPEVLASKTGETAVKVKGPTKLIVKPNVKMLGEKKETVGVSHYQINAKTSHKNLQYFVRLNGSMLTPVSVESFNKKTGEFKLKPVDLVQGANFIQLYFTQKDGDAPTLGDEKTVMYQPSLFQSWTALGGGAGLGVVAILTYFGLRNKKELQKMLSKLFKFDKIE